MTKEPDQATVLSVTKRRRYENIFLWVWSMPLIVLPLSELFFFYVSFDSGVFFVFLHSLYDYLSACSCFFYVVCCVHRYWFGGRLRLLVWRSKNEICENVVVGHIHKFVVGHCLSCLFYRDHSRIA